MTRARAFRDWYLEWHTIHLFRCRVRFCIGFSVISAVITMIAVVWASGQL